MSSNITPEFIRAIPKTDLHVHLDGSVRIPTLIELAREQGVDLPSTTEEGLRELVFRDRYDSLVEYLSGFAYTCAVLQDAESLERCAFELASDAFDEGVRYLEVRFAPQLHVGPDLDTSETLRAVAKGLARAETHYNEAMSGKPGGGPLYRTAIIVCAMRMFTEEFSSYFRDYVRVHRHRPMRNIIAQASVDLAHAAVAARDQYGLPIVGFDLAGQEDGYPASAHREAYDYAHRNFLKKTVHAGEAFGPESIFQAITELNADRIGHGYHVFSPEKVSDPGIEDSAAYVADLAGWIADRRITIEVCLSSNMQTNPEIPDLQEHNFRKMLEARLSVTLCTDNRTVSNTTVCKETELAVEHFGIDGGALKNLVVYGFKRSFFPGSYKEKRTYVRHCIDFYETLERQHGVEHG